MADALGLMRRVRGRLLWQKQLNTAGFFVSLALSSWAISLLIVNFLAFPRLVAVLPPVACCGFLGVALWRTRDAVNLEVSASLLDGRMQGKERFLTLVSVPQHSHGDEAYAVVQGQAEQLSASFLPEQDLPFTFEKRALWAAGGALLSVLLVFLFVSAHSPFFSSLSLQKEPAVQALAANQEEAIAALEKAARRLMTPTVTPQEQMLGAQLLALAQQLQDPSLSPQEKQRLVEETRRRLKLDVSLPQLFPFDLKIFAGKGKEDKGQGNDNENSQGGNAQAKANQNREQSSSLSSGASTATGNEAQPNPQQNGEKKEPRQPRQEGGGISFNFPQPQGKNTEQSQQDTSGTGQKPSQEQAPDSRMAGTDPNRPGEGQNNQARNPNNQGSNMENAEMGQNKKGEGGASMGQGKGERFLKPGEQPGGGFLTKDARFVKVRVPVGQETQDDGARTENANRAAPKTPYSNIPLKEAAPDQAQPKQPIPLEYRTILKE